MTHFNTSPQSLLGRPPIWRDRRSLLSCLVLVVSGFALTMPTHAERVTPPPVDSGDGPALQRSKRWWLDTWSHSMQETCFLLWMDQQTGSTAWRWVAPVSTVNQLYVWWSISVWDLSNKG